MKPATSGSCWVVCFLVLAALAEADDEPAWPQANGPFGNFNSRQSGTKLLDDLSLARQVWTSESRELGFAKGSAAGYAGHLTDPTIRPGTASGLILAEGKVFASSTRPRGGAWDSKSAKIAPVIPKLTPAQLETLKVNASYDADDLTVAIDAKTGKTVWLAVEEGKGMNRYSGKVGHFHLTPAYHAGPPSDSAKATSDKSSLNGGATARQGKVFSFGTCGHVYAYDAATGRKLWENDTGALVKPAAEKKAKLIKDGGELPGGESMAISLVVAGGVLVVPDYPGGNDVGLRGLDTRTGQTLWTTKEPVTSRWATPAVWLHQGKQYLVVATVKGELRMVDPADGKVLWTVTGLMATHFPLTCSERHVFVNLPSRIEERPGLPWARMAAYRLSPTGAEKAWDLPDRPGFLFENHFDICAMRHILTRDGRVYFFGLGDAERSEMRGGTFSILDEQTGQVLLSDSTLTGSPLFYLVEDRLLYTPDSAHGNTRRIQWQFYTTDPRGFRPLGHPWKPPHDNTTAYRVFIELPYSDGLFFMRNWQGQVVCYDLRQPPRAATWELEMRPAAIGLDRIAKPLRLFEREAGIVVQGQSLHPGSEQVGVPYGTWRRSAEWEPFDCPNLKVADGKLAGTVPMDLGSVVIPLDLDLTADAEGKVAGSWTRRIPADTVTTNSGTLTATAGVNRVEMTLNGIAPGKAVICLDLDGPKITRAAAYPGPGGQSWPEVDARGLTSISLDRIEGGLVLILNRDKWQAGRAPTPGVAVRLTVSAERRGHEFVGSWHGVWGEAYTFSGTVTGRRAAE